MTRETSLRKIENVFFALVFIVGILIFYGSSQVSDFLSSTTLTARVYGMFISGALMLVSAIRLILNIASAVQHKETPNVSFIELPRMLISAVTMIVYCYGISNIGYFTSTTLFCFIMLVLLSWKITFRSIAIFLVSSILFNVLLYYLFILMKVLMPNTPLI